MIQLTVEENISYDEQEAHHICEGKFCTDKDDKNYKNAKKIKDHCHYTGKFRGAAHSKCNLNYKVPKNILIIIHNASYDTHFVIKQLAEEFKCELDCIGENTEKWDDNKTITPKLRLTDSLRFMNFTLSDLANNLSGQFNSIEYKKCMERECRFVKLKNDRLICRSRECKEEYKRPIEGLIERLIRKFPSIY